MPVSTVFVIAIKKTPTKLHIHVQTLKNGTKLRQI